MREIGPNLGRARDASGTASRAVRYRSRTPTKGGQGRYPGRYAEQPWRPTNRQTDNHFIPSRPALSLLSFYR